ncbi:NUDIX hydrolase [Patescibacteria group bacterium]|nr:NUDIX hydrolase [Candidatus Falkowbacteria bacterium]MBU3905938.1 NUDIX hydrolase [Patescibacteria group bacterium]MCG2700299.1 NUDIX hydrolase [Candidatus Parcubacteria bacterium]MBU4015755.1 NUDIX hydrolase [Patescibacteria group bacterium]MBU4026510.1 NUDIX hydrolase [Patescibacteria group bacterium]
MSNKIKVGIIITDNQDNILLLKEKIKKNPTPLWNIVKGSYGDMGQETIFETAIRECQEEACVKVVLTGSLGFYTAQKKEKISTIITFTAKIVEGAPRIAKENEQLIRDEDISELKWFNKEEILKMKNKEFISNRVYIIIQNWIKKNHYPLNIIKQVEM